MASAIPIQLLQENYSHHTKSRFLRISHAGKEENYSREKTRAITNDTKKRLHQEIISEKKLKIMTHDTWKRSGLQGSLRAKQIQPNN